MYKCMSYLYTYLYMYMYAYVYVYVTHLREVNAAVIHGAPLPAKRLVETQHQIGCMFIYICTRMYMYMHMYI